MDDPVGQLVAQMRADGHELIVDDDVEGVTVSCAWDRPADPHLVAAMREHEQEVADWLWAEKAAQEAKHEVRTALDSPFPLRFLWSESGGIEDVPDPDEDEPPE